MKLATLFTIFAYASAGKNKPTVIEIYNEHGQVAIVNDENAAREGQGSIHKELSIVYES